LVSHVKLHAVLLQKSLCEIIFIDSWNGTVNFLYKLKYMALNISVNVFLVKLWQISGLDVNWKGSDDGVLNFLTVSSVWYHEEPLGGGMFTPLT
jgi:hypothetical protein